ncbi:MAG: TlyA family RNA methyltransferase [Alicyclobacillus sp.]|nr:TlyA family RNA methyltransferase [Alicyclobacillus sp.]
MKRERDAQTRSGEKRRIDVLLAERGLFPSREAARRAVMAGLVRVDGDPVDKPGTSVREDAAISVERPLHPYVSRGGLKLKRAIDVFQLDFTDAVVVDVGASTGGFTDCALQHGARHVFAVDVGYGQLAWSLRNDPRVTVLERTNFRHVDAAVFEPRPDIAVMDVSFISVHLLFPKLLEVLTVPAWIVSLIKPQFEAGRADVGKGGIVRDAAVHRRVLREHVDMGSRLGLRLIGVTYSPVTGGDGNIEYLGVWHRESRSQGASAPSSVEPRVDIARVVEDAWSNLRVAP